jgi:lysyl-tRNA synthetase, class II
VWGIASSVSMPARPPRAPFLLSLVATAAGLAGLVSVVTPAWAGRFEIVSELLSPAAPHVADGMLVASSLGLVLLGRGLARRRHRSWQAALWLLAISCIGHLLKERDVIDSVVSAVPFALLWWKRADFNAAGDPHGPPRALAAFLWALAGLYAYGITATFIHAELRDGPPFVFGDTVVNVTLGLVGIDPNNVPGRFEHGLTISLASASIICAAYVMWLALRPRDCAVSQHTADRRDARRLVERHGADSLAYFALRRDKSYFFNEERTAFLAYRAVGGVALVSGDPVGDPAAAPALLADFARHCHAHAWRVAALGVARQHLDAWHAIGLRTIYVGDEAVVHPASFSLEGRPIRKVRQSVSRLRKAGHIARIVRARDLTLEQRREVERVSRTWLRGQPERGFSMALDDMHAPDHGDAVFALGYDRDRRLVGFVHFVPAPATGDLSLSAMRRLHHTPNGLMEFLLCETFQWAGGRGIERISLNFNAFGDLLRSDAKLPAWERGLRFVLARADRFFQVERLLDFNRKFFPRWEPRYAAFERYSDLPLAALVLLSMESLVAWPRVLTRLWPHASPVPSAPPAADRI